MRSTIEHPHVNCIYKCDTSNLMLREGCSCLVCLCNCLCVHRRTYIYTRTLLLLTDTKDAVRLTHKITKFQTKNFIYRICFAFMTYDWPICDRKAYIAHYSYINHRAHAIIICCLKQYEIL